MTSKFEDGLATNQLDWKKKNCPENITTGNMFLTQALPYKVQFSGSMALPTDPTVSGTGWFSCWELAYLQGFQVGHSDVPLNRPVYLQYTKSCNNETGTVTVETY